MKTFNSYSRQSGAVLIVGLIIMLLMTIIGLAAVRGSNMQEMMAGNLKDRNLAFQAAEASLRYAEGLIASNTAGCGTYTGANGCFVDQSTILPVLSWGEAAWNNNSAQANINLSVSQKPRYVIEKLITTAVASAATGGAVQFGAGGGQATTLTTYRVTTLGYGATADSQVILQSTFRYQ